jgi:hypothetical protein
MTELVKQYQQLLYTLRALHTSGLCPLVRNERAFQLSYISWQKAEQMYQSKCFKHAEQIYWNKHIRSGFITELEYVLLMQYALLFEPIPFSSDTKTFWMRELERIELFVHQYAGFYCYIKFGDGDEDIVWFLQSSTTYFPGNQAIQQGAGDVLLGQLTALERYIIYCRHKVENLPG